MRDRHSSSIPRSCPATPPPISLRSHLPATLTAGFDLRLQPSSSICTRRSPPARTPLPFLPRPSPPDLPPVRWPPFPATSDLGPFPDLSPDDPTLHRPTTPARSASTLPDPASTLPDPATLHPSSACHPSGLPQPHGPPSSTTGLPTSLPGRWPLAPPPRVRLTAGRRPPHRLLLLVTTQHLASLPPPLTDAAQVSPASICPARLFHHLLTVSHLVGSASPAAHCPIATRRLAASPDHL